MHRPVHDKWWQPEIISSVVANTHRTYFCMTCDPEKLVDQNRLERDFSALLLGKLAAGRRQYSESVGVDLDME